ncbi:MAG: O-antigen translocase [Pseudomonadota bacterium]
MSEKNTYGQILKSSSVMGGAAVVTMIVGMVKTKFAAVLIGAAGVGLLASYTAIQGLIQTLAGLGINSSGVRDVAAAVAKGDQEAIGRAVKTLRRMCWLTGILGMLTVAALSPLIGQITFGSGENNLEIAALGWIVLFVNVSGGKLALMQGFRRIGDVARVNIISAVTGALLSTVFYFWLGMRGIVPALIISAGVQLIVSWHYAKRISMPEVDMTWQESLKEAGSMVRLGIAMMWTGLLSGLVSYATVLMIKNQFDLHAVGLYSAAFALSGMFVNFVLQAMGADFYPRLVGVAHDKVVMNRIVNEQTEIGLLLSVPGILATLLLAPWIIQSFYAKEFIPAVDLLRWFTVGCLGQVIAWPLGFVMLALGKGRWFVFTETTGRLFQLLLIFLMLNYVGFVGVAVALLLLYIFYTTIVYIVAKKLTGFTWSVSVKRTLLISIILIALISLLFSVLNSGGRLLVSFVLLPIISVYSLRRLINCIGIEHRIVQAALRFPGVRAICGF